MSSERLDEIQWRHPEYAMQMLGGIHNDTVHHYFAESPFFDNTSNNAVVYTQAMHNFNMQKYTTSRELFESRLRTMSGLEFMVTEAPSEKDPALGTGTWVIRKQTRKKREGQEDSIAVHSAYYVVGDGNVYMAPTLADILSFRMTTVACIMGKIFPVADEVREWSPALGHSYKPLTAAAAPKERTLASKDATPMPEAESQGSKAPSVDSNKKAGQSTKPDARLAEQSYMIHAQHGGEYMDENPITGKPGDFHLSKTGRKAFQIPPPPVTNSLAPLKTSGTTDAAPGKKDAAAKKGDKAPKTPTGAPGKPKRKKSKTGQTPTAL